MHSQWNTGQSSISGQCPPGKREGGLFKRFFLCKRFTALHLSPPLGYFSF